MTRVLIIKPSSLGDIVHGLQVLAAMRAGRDDLHVTWVVREMFAPLVEACAQVDRVVVFERRKGWRGLWAVRRVRQGERFDLVMDMQGLLRSGLMTWWARAPRKVGRPDAREGAGWFYHRRIASPAGAAPHHAVAVLLPFLAELDLPVALAGRVTWRPRPDNASVALARGALVLFPDSRRPEKNWGGYGDLTAAWLAREPANRVVWAGNARAEDGDRFAAAGERFTNLTARTALGDLPRLIEVAACVVSNDSGPMHLAAAMGQKVVAVFGPTDPRRFGPYPLESPQHRVVMAPAGDLRRLEASAVIAAVAELVTTD